MVGFIIGRGGETISSMQSRTGAKVQIQKEHELQPGQTLRKITVSAPTQEGLDQCTTMIESMVNDRVRAAGGSSGGSGSGGGGGNLQPKEAKIQQALDQGHQLKTVDVPNDDVGLVIGKGGQTIHDIQNKTGAQIQIPPQPNADNKMIRTISITCPTIEGANQAATMIAQVLETKKSHQQKNQQQHQQQPNHYGGPQTTIQVMVRWEIR